MDRDKADLTGLGIVEKDNLFVSEVLHKAYIAVDEKGTKAGAATIIEVKDTGMAVRPEPKEVILDRPFVYIIMDMENQIPLFMGTMMMAS